MTSYPFNQTDLVKRKSMGLTFFTSDGTVIADSKTSVEKKQISTKSSHHKKRYTYGLSRCTYAFYLETTGKDRSTQPMKLSKIAKKREMSNPR